MQCPVCNVPLSISSREGVEIDFCPQCRGVWLDRGELDKVIERASALAAPSARGDERRSYDDDRRRYDRDDRSRDDRSRDDRPRYDDDRRHRDDDRHGDPRHGDPRKKKRRGFLDDLFDFD